MSKWMGMIAGLGAALFVSAASPAHAAVCGDLNGTGILDAGDQVVLLQRVFGGPVAGDCGGLGTLQLR